MIQRHTIYDILTVIQCDSVVSSQERHLCNSLFRHKYEFFLKIKNSPEQMQPSLTNLIFGVKKGQLSRARMSILHARKDFKINTRIKFGQGKDFYWLL